MLHVLAHLVHLFKGNKKDEEEKDKKSDKHEHKRYVQMFQQNGSDVLDFSSQYSCNSSRSYAACNIAGPPSSFPNYGDFVKSFVLRTYGKWWLIAPSAPPLFKKISKSADLESNDFVDILFKQPVIPKALHILETYHPGSVIRVLALQTSEPYQEYPNLTGKAGKFSRWVTLWSGPVQMRPHVSQNFSPPLATTDEPINVIRLEFNHKHLDYYTEIDAVELLGNIVHEDETKERWYRQTGRMDLAITAKLMNQLSLNEEDVEDELLPDNGHFEKLPFEVVQLIFLHLKLDDIFRASATCRLFFHHCYNAIWYKELDLKPYWSKINDRALQGLQNRCANTAKLNLSWCGPYGAITSQALKSFLGNASQNLVCLRLSACTFVDNNALHSIAKYCPLLQELDLSSCTRAEDRGFKHLKMLKKMTRLNLYRVYIKDDTLLDIIECSSNLQHLNIGACPCITQCNDVIFSLTKNCRYLVSLDLWRHSSLTSGGLQQLASGCFLLEELEIGWCSNVVCSQFDCVEEFVKSHPKLKKLFMAAIRSISNKDVLAVADHCPNIQQFDILGTSIVDPSAIRQFMAKCPGLLFFDISFCSQIRQSFVQEMRTMYPKTSFKKSFQTRESDDENSDGS